MVPWSRERNARPTIRKRTLVDLCTLKSGFHRGYTPAPKKSTYPEVELGPGHAHREKFWLQQGPGVIGACQETVLRLAPCCLPPLIFILAAAHFRGPSPQAGMVTNSHAGVAEATGESL